MRTSALFGAKIFKFFKIYDVSARIRGGEERKVEPVWTFCVQEGRGSIFRDIVRTSFMNGP